jgi:hypothetical protein
MITIFSIPKPFVGHFSIIQRNAIRSWRRILGSEVILFGDETGTEGVSEELRVRYVPQVRRNEYGTPLLDYVFDYAQTHGKHDVQMYVNGDIILPPSLSSILERLKMETYVVCGQRWDLAVTRELPMNSSNWFEDLWTAAVKDGRPRGPSAIDYFIFRRKTMTLPPFAVGRPRWDNWLLWDAKMRGIPIVDATAVLRIVHQSHDYSHSVFGGDTQVGGPELVRNEELAGGSQNLLTLRDADWLLSESGLKRPQFARFLLSRLAKSAKWRTLFALKRNLQSRLGLR